jgi:hypothetical protein
MTEQEISSTLARIEQYSTWMVSDAETVQRAVALLRYCPGFETRAVAQMHLAKARLESALRTMTAAIDRYEAVPTKTDEIA